MARQVEKWFAMRTDFLGYDSTQLGIYQISAAAVGLYYASVAYVCRYGIDDCHRGQARHVGIKRPKAVIQELVDSGFWHPTKDPEWFFVCHEGQLWRRGDGKTRRAIPMSIREAVMQRDGYACVVCQRTSFLSLDHIHPYSLGGQDTLENLRVLCRSCNSKKGARI